MKTKEGWFSRKGMRVEHYVEMHDNKRLKISALCGCFSTLKEPWAGCQGLRHCKRCEAALMKRVSPPETPKDDIETLDNHEPKAKPFEVEVNYHATGETVPVTWIPVPDIKMVIDLLKRVKAPEACRISSGVISLVVDELQTRIYEAEERCSLPSTVTATWSPPEEE